MTPQPRCRDVLLLDYTGQMGNRLVLLSHFIAAAEEFGFRVHDFALAPHRSFFSGLRHNPFFTYPARQLGWNAGILTKALRKPLAGLISRLAPRLEGREGWLGYFNANHRPRIRLDGDEFARWMARHRVFIPWGFDYRCAQWVDRHAEKIRGFLRPCGPPADRAAATLANLRAAGHRPVGVHLRIGQDYREFFGGRWHFPLESYLHWMARFLALNPGQNTVFVICADVSLPEGSFGSLPASYARRPMEEDFALLMGCDSVLGTVSSFSQMACFLGQKPLHVLQTADQNLDSLENFKVPILANQLLPA